MGIWLRLSEDEVASLPQGDLRRRAEEMLEEQKTKPWQKFVDAARADDRVCDGELEVDEEATVSFSEDDGAYVLAWLWIEDKAAGINQPIEEWGRVKTLIEQNDRDEFDNPITADIGTEGTVDFIPENHESPLQVYWDTGGWTFHTLDELGVTLQVVSGCNREELDV